ncbi:MAG: YkgJ family cysteine cluster protein [Planctomycetota bacterium]|nr:YkgJ family cysteine cluster protein [Planctomycetota bacterium]
MSDAPDQTPPEPPTPEREFSEASPAPTAPPPREWFDLPDETGEAGLRFACTMCGNCCTGPEGYVLVTDDECAAMARRLGIEINAFLEAHTRSTRRGRSLTEVQTSFGLDCVFLDRTRVPGKAVCAVYEDRPAQCRTWPYWKSNLLSRHAWERAKRTCPGMDTGTRSTPVQIRVLRERVDI